MLNRLHSLVSLFALIYIVIVSIVGLVIATDSTLEWFDRKMTAHKQRVEDRRNRRAN